MAGHSLTSPPAGSLLVHLPVLELLLLAPDFLPTCTSSLPLPQTSHLSDNLSAFPQPMVLKVWSPELQHQRIWEPVRHADSQALSQTY